MIRIGRVLRPFLFPASCLEEAFLFVNKNAEPGFLVQHGTSFVAP